MTEHPWTPVLIKVLYVNRRLRDEEEMTNFLEALNKLKSLKSELSEKHLPDLLDVFTDEAVNIPPYQTFISFIWSNNDKFNREDVVRALVERSRKMHTVAPKWLKHLHFCVIANDYNRNILKDALRKTAAENRELVHKISVSLTQFDYDDEDVDIQERIQNDVDDVLEDSET